jgi:hypothetical protein
MLILILGKEEILELELELKLKLELELELELALTHSPVLATPTLTFSNVAREIWMVLVSESRAKLQLIGRHNLGNGLICALCSTVPKLVMKNTAFLFAVDH